MGDVIPRHLRFVFGDGPAPVFPRQELQPRPLSEVGEHRLRIQAQIGRISLGA
jgi:hypothetical protein